MNLIDIYERVCLVNPIEERFFFNHFTDTVRELTMLYGRFVIEEGEKFVSPDTMDDETFVRDLYSNAIVDNILYIMGAGESLKSEFIRESRNAYLKYWNDTAKGKHFKRARW